MMQEPVREGLKRIPDNIKYTKTAVTTQGIVGKRIRELRDKRNWSVQELANRCAHPMLTRSTIAKIETGSRMFVTHGEVNSLAEAFGLSRKEFLTGRPSSDADR